MIIKIGELFKRTWKKVWEHICKLKKSVGHNVRGLSTKGGTQTSYPQYLVSTFVLVEKQLH